MWVEIDFNKFYKTKEVAEILGLKTTTITRKCREWAMTCSNIWSEWKPRYLVKGQNILNFLSK